VTTQSVNITAKFEGGFSEKIPLCSLRISIKGVMIDIPIYFRVVATGEAEAKFELVVETKFGIKNNNPFFEREITQNFDFNFNARLELMAHIEAKVSVLGVLELYGVYGNLGLGLQTKLDLCECLPKFPFGGCFVIGTFAILRLGSIENYGATSIIPALNFGPIYFLPNEPTSFHYFRGGVRHMVCPARAADLNLNEDLLGEWKGLYSGFQGGLLNRVTGLRSIDMHIYHDGFGYRVLANVEPFNGGLDARFGYNGNITFDEETNEFQMQGTDMVHNPDGGNWSFVVFDGKLEDGVLSGINKPSTGSTDDNACEYTIATHCYGGSG
jgi:hypothetical protein